MTTQQKLSDMKQRAEHIFIDNIMKFWASDVILDRKNGGFYGKVKLDMTIVEDEPRALVLTGRMVYAFSKAYLATGNELYRSRAKRAFDYLIDYFRDPIYKGAYSTVNYQGVAVDTNKPTYGEAFLMFACAAYYQATQDPLAYEIGMETFHVIEEKVKLPDGGYATGFTRDWNRPAAMRIGKRAMEAPEGSKMFQHHLCQAYELFYRATKNEEVGKALHEFLTYITDTLYDPEFRCYKGMVAPDGGRIGTHQSFGHDCEISYLAVDIAEQLGEQELLEKTKVCCKAALETVYQKAIGPFGNFINSGDLVTGEMGTELVWWAQAEGVTGMLCAYQLTGDEKYLDASEKILSFIERGFVNEKDGDWYNSFTIDENGVLTMIDGMHGTDKLNGGKCPYHNSRMCMEVMTRTDLLLA